MANDAVEALSPEAQALLDDRAWRWRHSAWMLWGLLTCGLFSSIGYIYLAVRTRRPAFWILAAVSTVLTIAIFLVQSPSKDSTQTGSGSTSGIYNVLVVAAIALVVVAFFTNRTWLRWLAVFHAARGTNSGTRAYGAAPETTGQPSHLTPPPPPPPGARPLPNTSAPHLPSPQPPAPVVLPQPPREPTVEPPPAVAPPISMPSADAPQPPAQLAPPGGRRMRMTTRRADFDSSDPVADGDIPLEMAPARPATVLVNQATAADLNLVLGLDLVRCRAIEDNRKQYGPFTSPADFVRRAALTPLEESRLGSRIVV